jgi:excisionase family DNA binding protein
MTVIQQQSGPERKVFSVKEASEELGLSESTVRRMISDNRLRVSRTCGESGRIVISRQALDEFLGDRPRMTSPL